MAGIAFIIPDLQIWTLKSAEVRRKQWKEALTQASRPVLFASVLD